MADPNIRDAELSDDAARAGVTGHNVRYVLAAGLTGVILAFATIAIYFGFDTLQAKLSQALARSPADWLRELAPFAAVAAIGVISVGLLLGAWTLIAGRDQDASQIGMRLRVVAQFVIVCIIMLMLYVSG